MVHQLSTCGKYESNKHVTRYSQRYQSNNQRVDQLLWNILQNKNERVYAHFKCPARNMGKTQIQKTTNRRNEDRQMASSDLCAQTQNVCTLVTPWLETNGRK